MSDESPVPKVCPMCGATLSAEATEGLCPRCLLREAMLPTRIDDSARAERSPILAPEEIAGYFPQYEILRMLGRGGMGAVYLARQTALDRLVAIKVLPADLDGSDLNFAERFKNEARAMAKLSHPGIVAVHDFGETTNGLLYIVMEYVEGTDVQLMLATQGRLHSAHAVAITAHVCDALFYAHSRGIIHRDIKPSNIMVSSDGVVKVADFGLAKMSHAEPGTGLTQSGLAMGTPHFIAPEAMRLGATVDQRADIYAMGVMLYQMLTGNLPQGLFEMPSLQVPGLDPRYDGIVAKALRSEPAARYQDAGELRHDLDAILTQPVEKVGPDAEKAPAALPPQGVRAVKRKVKAQGLPAAYDGASAAVPPNKKGHSTILLVGLALLTTVAASYYIFGSKRFAATESSQQVHATKDEPFVNSLGMKFVPVPDTQVLFCIHETRYKDYAVYAESEDVDGLWRKQAPNGFAIKGPAEDHPVTNVSWEDAQRFCAWLSRKEGKTYRLPTDREWSMAVGIGDVEARGQGATPATLARKHSQFPWGNQWPPPKDVGNYNDESLHVAFPSADKIIAQGYNDGFPTTAPVMSFPPNALGLYDLGGNVFEWCEDWFDTAKRSRVLRGAGWSYGTASSSARFGIAPGQRRNSDGFRVVLDPARTFSPAVPSSPAPLRDTSPLKTNDRKVAEWVLSVGGTLVVVEGGKDRSITKAEDLPKGSFVIDTIRLIPQYADQQLPVESLRLIAGLRALAHLQIVRLTLHDDDYQVISALPALRDLSFTLTGIRDENIAALVSKGSFNNFYLHSESQVTQAGIAKLRAMPSLTSVGFFSCPFVTAETVQEIAQWQNLMAVDLGESDIGDAEIKTLSALPKLEVLRVVECPKITPEGLRAFSGRDKFRFFGFTLPLTDPASAVDKIVQIFPNLDTVLFSQKDAQKRDVELAALSRLGKLKTVIINGAGIGNSALEVLIKLPEIRSIELVNCSATADAIQAAMKANPRLQIIVR